MAEWSKALRSGRSRVLPAWVRIPLLTAIFYFRDLTCFWGIFCVCDNDVFCSELSVNVEKVI